MATAVCDKKEFIVSFSGSKKLHEEGGCGMCGSTEACKDDDSVSCTCDYHELQRNTAPYTVELVVRDKAIKNQEFPNMKVCFACAFI